MADDDGKSFSIPWAPLIALLAAGSGIFLFFGPPQSSRPASPGVYEGNEQLGGEDVDARLWQDPLGAVDDAIKNRRDGDPDLHSMQTFRERIQNFAKNDPRFYVTSGTDLTSLALLPVYIPASPYEEDVESRLRIRVAVLEGLEASGFIPEDIEHIGYLNLPHPRSLDSAMLTSTTTEEGTPKSDIWARSEPAPSAKTPETILLPYEWWTPKCTVTNRYHRTPLPRHVLVLWVQDGAFRDYPLRRLADLISWFRLAGPARSPDVLALGPQTSDTLDAMVAEARRPVGIDSLTRARLAGTHIYSCMAEAADSVLLDGTNDTCEKLLNRAVSLSGSTPSSAGANDFFLRTALTDDGLVSAMIAELNLHNVKNWRPMANLPDNSDADDVAIISEQDTFAARAVQQTLIEKFVGYRFPPGGLSERDWGMLNLCKCLHPFTYLRGIDGELPSDQSGQSSGAVVNGKPSSQPSSENGNDSSDSTAQRQQNAANGGSAQDQGLNQADYLERLVDRIVAKNDELLADGRSFKAVAILGSDVYDKLEILEALRPRLQGPIYFTNHLDARFSLPEEWDVTRNLFVFSSYGLMLNDQYQRGIPPFRDSIQTAIFAATLEAMRVMPGKLGMDGSARVFEIARTGPFDLSPADNTQLHPPPADIDGVLGKAVYTKDLQIFYWTFQRWVWALLEVLLGTGLFLFARRVTGWGACRLDRDENHKPPHLQSQPSPETLSKAAARPEDNAPAASLLRFFPDIPAAAVLAVGLGILWCILLDRPNYPLEPFSFKDGISIFPSIIIWHISVLISAYFIWKAHLDLKKNNIEICRDFNLTLVEAKWRDLIPKFSFSRGKHAKPPPVEPDFNGPLVNVDGLWKKYQIRGKFLSRMIRVIPMALIYYFTVLILINIVNPAHPPPPMRGGQFGMPGGLKFYLFFLPQVLIPMILSFFVIDATRLHEEFVRHCRRAPTHWPTATYDNAVYPPSTIGIDNLSSYLDIRLIAKRTEAVSTLIYYPFVFVFLIILTRASYFEERPRSIGIIIVQGLYLLLALYSAYRLPAVAKAYRQETLDELERSRSKSRNSGEKKKAGVLKRVIDEIKNLDQGAFVSLWEQPAVRAILLPSGSIGIWTLLQYLPHS